jgi:hypothetical protein
LTTFEADFEVALDAVIAARADLVATLQRLSDDDLEHARDGDWSIRRIVEHIIECDYLYATGISVIRNQPPPATRGASCEGQPVDQVLCLLDASGKTILSAARGVVEDDFYRIQRLGDSEYSVLSILEKAAHHDREHAEQISGAAAA